jgi:hypothetical protein
MAGLQDFGYSFLVLIVLFLAMLWRTPADMEQEKILEIKELSLRLENELTKRNALPLLEILRDETRTDYLLFNVRNIDPRNLDLEECRINFKELKILFGKKGGKFNEKNGFSFSWEDKIIPHPESPWPGAPTCLKTVKFKDFEILKISHQVNHDMKSSAHFWVEFCDCSGKYDKGVDCEEIDANHSIIEIDIVIELLAKFGDRNIVYPFSRRIRFEKVLNTISEEGITVYDSFDFHIYDF